MRVCQEAESILVGPRGPSRAATLDRLRPFLEPVIRRSRSRVVASSMARLLARISAASAWPLQRLDTSSVMGYRMFMRKPISVTLSHENLLWLKGQAGRTARGSVSEVLDQLVTGARVAGHTAPQTVRSVVGSVDLPPDDPDLNAADAYVRSAFATSLRQPLLVREEQHTLKRRRRG